MELFSFDNRQTTLDLNGPVLSWLTEPSSDSVNTCGVSTFTGIATATSFVGDGSSLTGIESWNQQDTWLFSP